MLIILLFVPDNPELWCTVRSGCSVAVLRLKEHQFCVLSSEDNLDEAVISMPRAGVMCVLRVSSPSLFLLDSRMEVQWSTWGRAAWTSSQREMLWMASDRAGDSPWSLFSTSTRSKDWGGSQREVEKRHQPGTKAPFFDYLNVPHGPERGKACGRDSGSSVWIHRDLKRRHYGYEFPKARLLGNGRKQGEKLIC